MPQMTDEQIKRSLMFHASKNCTTLKSSAFTNILDLINRLEAQNNDLFYKLNGVMLSVDKWLEGKELKQDEVNRAITMREKTLRLVEGLENDVEKFKGFYEEAAVLMRGHSNENTLLMKENVELKKKLKTAKSEAYREFAERLKKSIEKSVDNAWHSDGNGIYDAENVLDDIDNLLKELTEKNDFK